MLGLNRPDRIAERMSTYIVTSDGRVSRTMRTPYPPEPQTTFASVERRP